MQQAVKTIKRITGEYVQALVTSEDGKSGTATLESRTIHVEYFYDTHAITMIDNKPTITGSGMWYEQIEE